jgi:hypothetical protein
MDLANKTLEKYLQNAPLSDYPQDRKEEYFAYYVKLKDKLKPYQEDATVGANLQKQGELLNKHGLEHVEKVIQRASELVDYGEWKLKPLEVYILLCAIQLHDVGNLYGRDDHVENIQKVMERVEEACGQDDIERIQIKKIAQAHGGKRIGGRDSKDTISQLSEKEPLRDEEIRPRLLASILRFADELAEDKSRANIGLLEEGKIPVKSEIFHVYAYCLESVLIRHEEHSVELYFKISKENALKKLGKLDEKVYLIDEIYDRAIKMHRERIYCMRFCKGKIDIEKILINIGFYGKYLDDKICNPISFTLHESGYPEKSKEGIHALCDSLTDGKGKKINGEYIRNKIKRKEIENIILGVRWLQHIFRKNKGSGI